MNISQPCFGDLKERNFGPSKHQMRSLPPPAIIENVRSNLTAPGSFYYDRTMATITYIPRPGETLPVVEGSAFTSKEETLLKLNGTQNMAWVGVAS